MRVIRVLAPNPGVLTLEGTNTWIVGDGPSLVVDPGPDDAAHLAEVAREARGVAAVLLTHDHVDHAEGATRFAAMTGAPLHAARAAGAERVRDGQAFRARGAELVAVATPGHSADHIAFHQPATGALYTGDAVLGRGTSVVDPPDGDLAQYLRSLRRLRELAPRTIHPGHGPLVLRAGAKLDEYLQHRADREAQVLAALARGSVTPEGLVPEVYPGIDPAAEAFAARTMLAHLLKLQVEGVVEREGAAGPFRVQPKHPCERCGRPTSARQRLCAACAVSSLQEPG